MFSYYSYNQLEDFFLGKKDIPREKYHVSVIAELLYVFEQYKKNKFELASEQLHSKYDELVDLIEEGTINFIELDDQILIDNLFEEDESGIVKLDESASRSSISPRFSINLLCLKGSGCGCYWDESVFDEMLDFFNITENHE